mmetsp:Transcript_611/g.1411  ORF Transcript_611/g.1411 Transcript_611/m.1411 type:complete len:418 (+) Transcript_611:471-1724(+)
MVREICQNLLFDLCARVAPLIRHLTLSNVELQPRSRELALQRINVRVPSSSSFLRLASRAARRRGSAEVGRRGFLGEGGLEAGGPPAHEVVCPLLVLQHLLDGIDHHGVWLVLIRERNRLDPRLLVHRVVALLVVSDEGRELVGVVEEVDGVVLQRVDLLRLVYLVLVKLLDEHGQLVGLLLQPELVLCALELEVLGLILGSLLVVLCHLRVHLLLDPRHPRLRFLDAGGIDAEALGDGAQRIVHVVEQLVVVLLEEVHFALVALRLLVLPDLELLHRLLHILRYRRYLPAVLINVALEPLLVPPRRLLGGAELHVLFVELLLEVPRYRLRFRKGVLIRSAAPRRLALPPPCAPPRCPAALRIIRRLTHTHRTRCPPPSVLRGGRVRFRGGRRAGDAVFVVVFLGGELVFERGDLLH